MNINELPFDERLQIGKFILEKKVYSRLFEIYKNRMKPAGRWDDIYGKTDFFLDELLCSIKCRCKSEFDGDDLLSCLSQPYTGKNSLLTGRDSQEYHKVFCLNLAQTKIRNFDGPFVHKINLALVEGYRQRDSDILKLVQQSYTPDGFNHEDWHCQLRSFRDKDNKQLKVCSFIPEEYALFHNAVEIIDM